MKKNLFAGLLAAGLVATLGLAACGQTGAPASDTPLDDTSQSVSGASDEQATEPATDGAAYGYAGTNPIEASVYKYMAEEVSKDYDKADVSIPIVQIVHVDDSNPDEVLVAGDFWINNYDIAGDTLECVSGGNYPGVMHVSKDGDSYAVTSFDVVADGSDFDASAQKLFGEYYEDFMKVYGDADTREELRTAIVSDYVKLNGLEVTQYQDYGWDPVQLNK